MANALVEQLRRAQPEKTAGQSDAELTDFLARSFEARGDLAHYLDENPDFHKDVLDLRNPGGDIGAQTAAAAKAAIFDRIPAQAESAGALGADIVSRDELAGNLGLAGPARAIGDTLRGMAAENNRKAQQRIADAGGRTITRVQDIRPLSPRDYVLWALPTFAESAPALGAGLVAGVAAGVITKNPMAAMAAVAAVGAGQSAGDIYSNLSEDPNSDPEKNANAAVVGGIAGGALGLVPELMPLAKLFPGASKGVIGNLIGDVMGRGGLAGAAKGALTQMPIQGATGSLQEAVNIAAEEYATGKKLDPDVVRSRILNAGATGAMIAAPTGAAFGALPSAHGEQAKPTDQVVNTPATLPGAKINSEWTAFSDQSQSLGIPRAEMPQVKSESRGALTQFLKARGIDHVEEEVVPGSLKPTQNEYSQSKVDMARESDADRAILVSSDNYVVDGHHQWLADLQDDPTQPIRAIRLDAPIAELLPQIKEFPSAEQAGGATKPNGQKEKVPTEADVSVVGGEKPAAAVVDQPVAVGTAPTAPTEEPKIVVQPTPSAAAPVKTEAPTKPLSIADIEPSRIAKTTSNDLTGDEARGGRYAIAIEKGGQVEVRNVYERKDGTRIVENSADLVPDVRVRGTGRNVETFVKNGWTVRQAPFQLSEQRPHLKMSMPAAEFDAQIAAHKELSTSIISAINDGRGDRVIEAGLKATDPQAWQAVQFLRDKIAADTGANPSHVQIGLGTRVDSVATRDTLRTNATAKKLAAGDLLRSKDGKVFGLFTDAAWGKFKSEVASGNGDAALSTQFGGSDSAYKNWALKIGELGATDQIGGDAHAAKAAGARISATESLDANPHLADDVAALEAATPHEEDSPPTDQSGPRAALNAVGLDSDAIHAAVSELRSFEDLTAADVQDVITTLPEAEAFRDTLKRAGRTKARDMVEQAVQNLLTLHDEAAANERAATNGPGTQGRDPRGNGASVQETQEREIADRLRELLHSQPVEPVVDSAWRASDGAVTRGWGEVVASLSDAGLQVSAVQAAIDSVDKFYRQTGGRTDARRFVELVMKDMSSPSPTDLEVATHEAVHVLFAAEPAPVRDAIHRAVAKLQAPDPSTNRSLQTSDPTVLMSERLAVSLQGSGIDAGTAKEFGTRIVRFLKEIYFRSARALAMAFGLQDHADQFALRYFSNRLTALLNGDFAPQSLANALGGRPLTWSERATMLPGFGRSVGRVLNGAIGWSPKIPTTAEGLSYNLDLAYSQPMHTPIGETDPAFAINRDVAVLNHAIQTDAAALTAISSAPGMTRIMTAASNGMLDFGRWFRGQFHFEDPMALKQMALTRLDPKTQQPATGANPAQALNGFTSANNAAQAKIHAYMSVRERMKSVSSSLTQSRAELARATNQQARAQQSFLDAHKNYLNAEGLTSLVLSGVRQLISRERKLDVSTGSQVGAVMQQLRELDARSAKTLDREYSPVFAKLFVGKELQGRNLFNLLDQMVNEAGVDFSGQNITDIRQKLAERSAAGMTSPEVGLLLNATPSSRALLATVVAYGKTHPEVLAQIERRRLKNIAERMDLQDKLAKLVADRDITNQAVTDLPKTAKLEERARVLYMQAKQKDRAYSENVRSINERIGAAEAALPVYKTAAEQLQSELGVQPEYAFGDGMTYRVPVTAAGNVTLEPRTLRLDSTHGVTDRATLDQHLESMTHWLAMKEAAGEIDANYLDVRAARHALLEGGYFESDVRKTDTWVRGNVFQPIGAKAEATGLPSGRLVGQMFNKAAAVENELRNEGQARGDKNNRMRDAAVATLNRGRKTKDMTPDRYYAEIAEPAMSIAEKSNDLLELGLSREQVMGRVMQRVINHLLGNPSTEGFVRGKEQAVSSAIRSHLEALESTSKFFNDTNTKYGVGVRDERLIVDRGDGKEAVGIRQSLPVGPMTFSRKASALVGRVYRLMNASGWGAFKDVIEGSADLYAQSPDMLRQAIAKFFPESVLADFAGAMATTDTYSVFDAPVLQDGVTRGEADPARVAKAWRDSNGDIVSFIDAMYDAHGGTTNRAMYAAEMLGRFQEYYAHLGDMLDSSETGMSPNGLGRLSNNLMIDARVLDRWPTAWSEHLFFDPHTNHSLARRVAAQVAFGRDTERLAQVWTTMEKEIKTTNDGHEVIKDQGRKIGLSGRQLDKYTEADYVARLGAGPGKAEYARVERLAQLRPAIAEGRDGIRAFYSSKHNQLDVVRFASQAGSAIAFGMLNNPGTALLNLADLFSPVAQGGVSGATLKQVARNWIHLGEGITGSVAQAVGLDLLKSSRLQNLYVSMGLNDPAVALQYIGRSEDGLHSDILADGAARGRDESAFTKGLRVFQRTMSVGITPLGEKSRFTALRPLAPFQQFIHETMRASTLSTWQRVEDMVLRGMDHFASNPALANDPNFKLTATSIGLKGAEGAAFEALRSRMAEGYGIELTSLTREAMTRQAGPRARNELLSNTARATLQGMVANEFILEGNIATMTPKAWTSGFARLVLPLWGWPIRRALQVARIGLDPKDNLRAAVVGRGLVALGVMAGAGLAMSMLADEYHEKIVGRKRNLRSVEGIPSALQHGQYGQAFMAMMENVNRAGTFGLWGELVNTAVNGVAGGGDNRTLSFDQRVVMMNSMLTLGRALISTPLAQHEVDYTGVVRPALMALGGNSALQYVQIGNHWLGLDNIESRFVDRLNAQNALRVAGREVGLEVRGGGGTGVSPTPLTPIISRMVLAAYAGDRREFLDQWRAAVQEARADKKEDPVAYVRDQFAERNPLKNVFRAISEDDYVKLLRSMDDTTRSSTKSAVNRFNAYAESLDAKAFTGTRPRLEVGASLRSLTRNR